MIAWVALALAVAKPPATGPVGPDPVAVQAAEDAACKSDVPEGFQIHTGWATDADGSRAVQLAAQVARQAAITAACSGKSDARCALIRRHVEPWKTAWWNPISHRACAHVGIRRDWLDDDQADTRALQANLAVLARQIADGAAGRPVALRPALWSGSGCSAGTAGGAVDAELRNALGAIGGVVLVAPGTVGAIGTRVALDPRGAEVVLSASVDDARTGGTIPLKGFSIPADLLAVSEAGEDCAFDTTLGLVDGRRAGADGRVVELAAGDRGTWCAGDTMHPTLVVDRPSAVHVFSVDRGGTALLVWPPPGGSNRVERTLDLGEFTLFETPSGDEKLVAVAVDPRGDIGRTAGWNAVCELPGKFDAAWYASGAAAAAATFEVLPAQADECYGRAAVAAPQMPAFPKCGR